MGEGIGQESSAKYEFEGLEAAKLIIVSQFPPAVTSGKSPQDKASRQPDAPTRYVHTS